MNIHDFVEANRDQLLAAIRRIRNHHRLNLIKPEPVYTDQDLVRWILNDHELYTWALSNRVEGI
jgi:hypothetical protein